MITVETMWRKATQAMLGYLYEERGTREKAIKRGEWKAYCDILNKEFGIKRCELAHLESEIRKSWENAESMRTAYWEARGEYDRLKQEYETVKQKLEEARSKSELLGESLLAARSACWVSPEFKNTYTA